MANGSRIPWASGFLCLCVFASGAPGIEYVFPAAAGVVDITKAPYNADRTGTTDVSAILTKAANDIIGIPGWGPTTLYLPNGTYLVKNTFAWSLNSHGNGIGPHLIGQSRKGTVIKLAKGTWPLGTEGKPVIQTGAGDENNFNKAIINLTVLVDSNNAGAIGIAYVSNNDGLVSDVDVISADGKGLYGIQSAGNYTGTTVGGNGPFIIRRTYIKGFQVGMRACGTQSETVSQIRLAGQSKYGLWASCGNLTIDSLTTNDTCIAVEAEAAVLLTNAVLSGGSPTAYGIRNFVTSSFFRDVKTTGYKFSISSVGIVRPPLVSSFDEYSPSGCIALFPSATKSMNIPARYPPEVPWESDFTKWAFIEDYKTGGRTDVQAFQAAIDDPAKTTVCLKRGASYLIDGPVYVRGNISRIYAAGGMFHTVNTNGKLIIDAGSAPAIIIQKVSMENVGDGGDPDVYIVKRDTRTLVLESLNQLDFSIEGGGDTYITDITSRYNYIDNAQARVWLWQWEGEPVGNSTLTVRNGIVRSVGYYDEGDGSMLFCLGGITEILGYWDYNICTSKSGDFLLTVGNNANVSAAGVWQQNFCSPWAGYDELVSETRSGTTKILYGSAGAGRVVSPAGGNIALYTAYDSAQIRQALTVGVLRPTAPVEKNRVAISVRQKTAGMEISYSTESPGPVTLIAYDLAGRIIAVVKEHPAAAGMHRTLLPKIAGVTCIRMRAQGTTAYQRIVAHAQ
jgi:hypothetical protein